MAISIVQQIAATSTTGTTVSATFGSTPTNGNILIACLAGNSGAGWSATGWTQAINSSASLNASILWSTSNGSTTAFTFTQTGGGSGEGMCVWMAEVSGLNASPVDKTGAASSASSGSVTLSTATTTSANELWVGAVNSQLGTGVSMSGVSATNGWTVQNSENADGTTNDGLISVTNIVSATGTPSTAVSWTPNAPTSYAVATFAGPGGGGGATLKGATLGLMGVG